MEYAKFLQKQGIGFFITNNGADKLNTVTPPVVIFKNKKINEEEIREVLSPNGVLSKNKEDFEFREGQIEMSIEVAKSFNDNRIAILEAGTGTGKSLAYLIPAYLWAKKNNERVVISTNTINLQSQILNKDIPIVKKILNSDINAVLIKGRKNYLCKLKLLNLQSELEFERDNREMNEILNWAQNSSTGCVDELSYIPNNNVWDKVSSDNDFCVGRRCSFYESCFLQISRRKASESNILIVNHHILFADIEIRSLGKGLDENLLLPPYRKIIFDEAHNIEKSANSFFTNQFSKSGFYKFIANYRVKSGKSFLSSIANKFLKSGIQEIEKISVTISEDINNSFNLLNASSFEIFEKINDYIKNILDKKEYFLRNGSINNLQYRIRKEEWLSREFNDYLIEPLSILGKNIGQFNKSYGLLCDSLDSLSEKVAAKYEFDIKIIKAFQNKIETFQSSITALLNSSPDDNAAWFDIFGKPEDPLFTLNVSPVNIGQILKDKLYDVFDSIVFTSATLSVDNKFNFFKNITGLSLVNNKTITEKIYDSPFDYLTQVLFVSPVDIPEPNSYYYNDKLNEYLKDTIEETGGSTFVLFTSYNQLQKSYSDVAPYLEKIGLRSYYQGEMQKEKLLDSFKNDISSNLFATDSFWEGVDAPGDTLKYVVLTKLPFRMPNEPIEEAKIEDIQKKGLNPFNDYTLPKAVIRFKQGFGRLIRTKKDYGIVALLDSRVLTKSYGKLFFRSLPRCKFASGNSGEMKKEIAQHLKDMSDK
jgi:ATP-dependent DNA helicase DinG